MDDPGSIRELTVEVDLEGDRLASSIKQYPLSQSAC